MRTYLYIFLIIALSACGAESAWEIPTDLQGKRDLLKEKRSELRELNNQLEELETAIAAQDSTAAPKLTLVSAINLSPQTFVNYANIQATVQANETAFASSELPGRILNLNVNEGDNIRRGQLIATVNVEDIQTQRAEVETATELAKTVFERQKRLWDQNIGSEIQYLQAKNNYERLEKSLATIDAQLSKRNIYAPITGTVEMVNLRAGENAMPGAPIVTIISTSDLKIIADAPEEFLTTIQRGKKVEVDIPTLGESFPASVGRVGRTVDPANRTFEVEIDIPRSKANKLKANLLAEVNLVEQELADVLVLSQDLIQQEIGGRYFVFVVRSAEDGLLKAEKVYVTTGEAYDNQTVVTSGLQAGDQIVSIGSRGLVDGQLISLNTSETPATNG